MDIKITILIISLIYFIIGGIVYSRNRKNLANISLAFFTYSTALWAFSFYFYEHPYFLSSFIWIKIVYFFVFFIIFSLFYLSSVFPYKSSYSLSLPILIYCLWSLPNIYLLFFTNLWIKDVVFQPSGYRTILGPLYFSPNILWSVFTAWAFYNLIKKHFKTKGVNNLQSRYAFLGIFLFVIPAVIVDAVLPLLTGNSGYFWLSPIFSFFFIGCTTYAIIRYRLMDIRIVIKKSAVYLISFSLVSGLALLIMFTVKEYTSFSTMVFGVGVVILSLLIFDPVKAFFQKLADKLMFREVYTYQEAIKTLGSEVTRLIKLDKIIDLVVDTIKKTMRLDRAGILLFSLKTSSFQVAKVIGFNQANGISLVRDNFLTLYLEKTKNLIVLEELDFLIRDAASQEEKANFEKLKVNMKRIEASLCLPLISKNKLQGIILLGAKVSGDAYTREDLDLLETLANQASVAIENAIQYEEIQDLTGNLQQKVDEQVEEIRKKNIHLKKLLKMKGEFLDIASHQLRTPVSVILGTISMFKDRSVLRMPEETREKFVDNIYKKALKLRSIIEDILTASEMDAINFEERLNFEPTQIEDITSEVYQDNISDAEKSGLTLTYHKPDKKLPLVSIDRNYVKEALTNIVTNAIQYTEEKGKVIITTQEKGGSVIIKVQDTGIGIPKNEIENLFKKFSRASNAVNMHTDGSGLGLFIVKKIIDSHPGTKIFLESEEGKGTSFSLSFPIIK